MLWSRGEIQHARQLCQRRRWMTVIALSLLMFAGLLGLGSISMAVAAANRDSGRAVLVPVLVLGVICALPLIASGWFIARAWSLRIESGRCHGCGYDLRQSTAVCPECGAATEPASPPRSSPGRRRMILSRAGASAVATVPLYGYFVDASRDAPAVAILIILSWTLTCVLALGWCVAVVVRPPESRSTILFVMGLAIAGFVGFGGSMVAVQKL